MTPMTEEQLREIEARAEAASPGSWHEVMQTPGTHHGVEVDMYTFVNFGDDTDASINAHFIAHARQDVPTLVAEVRRLDSATDRVLVLHRRNEHSGRCEHCSENDYPDYAVSWPCETVRAIKMED